MEIDWYGYLSNVFNFSPDELMPYTAHYLDPIAQVVAYSVTGNIFKHRI